MFLGLLTLLVLLSLGMLNAQAIVCEKHEKLKDIVGKLLPLEGYIGLAGVAFGVLGVLNSIGNISYIGAAPLYFLIGLTASVLSIALGLLSAAALIKQQVPNLAGKLDQIVSKIQPHHNVLGLAGIAVAIFYFITILAF